MRKRSENIFTPQLKTDEMKNAVYDEICLSKELEEEWIQIKED